MFKHNGMCQPVGSTYKHVRTTLKLFKYQEELSLALANFSLVMAGHLLLAVFSLVVHFHAVYSAITAQQMLAAVTQFSKDFTYPRINEVA